MDGNNNGNNNSTELLPVSVVAARLHCSENHVRRLIEHRELHAVDIAQPGSRPKARVTAGSLAAFINARGAA